ncbi:MAG: HAD-IA family hydrolase [Verrucomicrobiota bacterium]|nr:HAD-IA family hydrolase [Verrucomicrobiota bacterium]
MQNVDGVIFDMDGVLCDSEPFICEAACLMFKQNHKREVHPYDFIPFVGTGENRYLGGVAEKHGVTLELDRDKATTYALYLGLIKGRLDPLPGTLDFIGQCRAHGLSIAVATSADRIKLDGNLVQIGIPASTFDVCVTGNDVKNKKPDPEVFLVAAAGMKLDPARCIVVEDAVNGIKAGCAAGSPCLGLTTSYTDSELRGAGARWIAPHLGELPEDFLRHIFQDK